LPEIYREYCHWLIVNVEHSVSTDGWTTKLDSRMVVDIPKLYKDVKGVGFETREFKPFMVKPGQDLVDRINELRKKLRQEEAEQGRYSEQEEKFIKRYQERIEEGTGFNNYALNSHKRYLKEYPLSYEEYIRKNPQHFPKPDEKGAYGFDEIRESLKDVELNQGEVIDADEMERRRAAGEYN